MFGHLVKFEKVSLEQDGFNAALYQYTSDRDFVNLNGKSLITCGVVIITVNCDVRVDHKIFS